MDNLVGGTASKPPLHLRWLCHFGTVSISGSRTIAKSAVENQSNRIVNPKQNVLFNRRLQTLGDGLEMLSSGTSAAAR